MSISSSLDWGIPLRKREEKGQELKPELPARLPTSGPDQLLPAKERMRGMSFILALGKIQAWEVYSGWVSLSQQGDKPAARRCSHFCPAQVAGVCCHFK